MFLGKQRLQKWRARFSIFGYWVVAGVSALALPKLFSFLRYRKPRFFISAHCLPPIDPLWPCCLPRHAAIEPMDIGAGVLTLVLLLLPWELARKFALILGRNRLHRFLSVIVGFLLLLYLGAWMDGFWEDRRLLLFGALGQAVFETRVIDFFGLWCFEWGVAWTQLIPAAIITSAVSGATSDIVHKKTPVSQKIAGSLPWIPIVAGSAFELFLEIAVFFLDLSEQSMFFTLQKAVGCFVIFLVTTKQAWLLRNGGQPHRQIELIKVKPDLLSLVPGYRIGLWLFAFGCIAVLFLQTITPPQVDVVASPLGQSKPVCPVLSTAELANAGYLLFFGLVYGELLKIAGAAVPQGVALWRAGIRCQLAVAFPAASALLWNWLQAGAVILVLTTTGSHEIAPALADELQAPRGGTAPWLLAVCALFGAWSCSSLLSRNARKSETPRDQEAK